LNQTINWGNRVRGILICRKQGYLQDIEERKTCVAGTLNYDIFSLVEFIDTYRKGESNEDYN